MLVYDEYIKQFADGSDIREKAFLTSRLKARPVHRDQYERQLTLGVRMAKIIVVHKDVEA